MEIILYKNKSSHNTINKELEEVKTINAVFKRDFNFLSSVLTIHTNDPIDSNYLYIPIFKRYYFITNQEIIAKNIFNIYIEVDVLESFKTDIFNCEALINKTSTNYNKYYDDGSYQSEVKKEVEIYKSDVIIDFSKPTTILVTLGGI